ncbi:MAG: ABC transporter substrate-binding protein [SAR202 cluster bacterium]|nr:ABC transporter substrate-binding protein [SAR202 cluster bacterium]
MGILTLSRPSYSGMLLYTDNGRCSWVGRDDFSVCKGQYAQNKAVAVVPGILESWEQPDPTSYVFKVRKGVLWPAIPPLARPDREVTAEDIVWFLETTKDQGILKGNFSLVKSFQAIDRHTLKITMTAPNADFLKNMAHTSMGIFPKECHAEKDCLGTKLISPGPFLMKESIPREKVIFERNPEFHLKGLPYTDRLTALHITDASVQKSAFVTSKLDSFIAQRDAEADNLLKQIPGSQLHAQGGIGGVTITWRIQLKGPLADVRVRRAMAMTMDHPTMWEASNDGFNVFTPLISRDYFGAEFYMTVDQAGDSYQYNPEAAKKLLAEAGYASGFKVPVFFSSFGGLYYDQMLFLQSQWKRHLGVDLEIKVIDSASLLNSFYAGTWEGFYNQGACWIRGCWGTADDAFQQFIKGSPQNVQKIDDPFIEDIYLKQRGEMDPAKRVKLLWEFDQYELTKLYQLRIGVATGRVIMQPWEMNGASHETMWFVALNGPTWQGMHDTSKYPGGKK